MRQTAVHFKHAYQLKFVFPTNTHNQFEDTHQKKSKTQHCYAHPPKILYRMQHKPIGKSTTAWRTHSRSVFPAVEFGVIAFDCFLYRANRAVAPNHKIPALQHASCMKISFHVDLTSVHVLLALLSISYFSSLSCLR